MIRKYCFSLSLGLLAALLTLAPAWSLEPEQQKAFDRILYLTMDDLTAAADALLEQKYPDEDWDKYDFPSFVFTNASVEVGYRIAVTNPDLLGQANIFDRQAVIPCYCFCDAMGHKNLLYCFFQEGKVGGKYDDHAANCNICYSQAMLAFLWNDLGATHAEIIAGMEKRFERIIQLHKEGKI